VSAEHAQSLLILGLAVSNARLWWVRDRRSSHQEWVNGLVMEDHRMVLNLSSDLGRVERQLEQQ
jgi:hypothetical protein